MIHGQLIKGSGLLEVLRENQFSMIGLSSVVDVNNIKRARYTLQITLCSLFKLLDEAISDTPTDTGLCKNRMLAPPVCIGN